LNRNAVSSEEGSGVRHVSKVIISDCHPVVVHGLKSILDATNDFKVLAICYDGTECIRAVRCLSPDIVLLDIHMPGLSGLDVLAAATSEHLPARIVFLTASVEDRDLITATAKGAYGVLLKEAAPEVLVRCLRQVARGQRLLPIVKGHSARAQEREANDVPTDTLLMGTLTERQRQVVHLVSEGLSNKELARRLNISDGTIKLHLHHIYQKLAINNRTALAALAHRSRAGQRVKDEGGR
jgi:two-component system nitrate/nitrite response regulator NarL